MDFVPAEKATTIRVPATANLQIDSADRNENIFPSPFDFQITSKNSLLNGFFTRIGTTEVVLEWNEPNGQHLENLGPLQVSLSTATYAQSTFTLPPSWDTQAFYNAETALNNFSQNLSLLTGTGFSVSTINNTYVALVNANDFQISTCALSKALDVGSVDAFDPAPITNEAFVTNPDLRPYRYIDFVSPQLTYNQDLKDSTSAPVVRDVLCRWYFDWDNQPQRDALGFPIEMGYEPFRLRRLFNPPKQIRWDSRQPVGNLSFQVFGNGELAPIQPNPNVARSSDWLITAQVSEN